MKTQHSPKKCYICYCQDETSKEIDRQKEGRWLFIKSIQGASKREIGLVITLCVLLGLILGFSI